TGRRESFRDLGQEPAQVALQDKWRLRPGSGDLPAHAPVPPAEDFRGLLEEKGCRVGVILTHPMFHPSGAIAALGRGAGIPFAIRWPLSFSSAPSLRVIRAPESVQAGRKSAGYFRA